MTSHISSVKYIWQLLIYPLLSRLEKKIHFGFAGKLPDLGLIEIFCIFGQSNLISSHL